MTKTETEVRKVFLFSGHMIDAPGRKTPRFPPDKEPIAAAAIADKLRQLAARPGDRAVSGAACGGDLLFAEAALASGLRLDLYLTFDEPKFLEDSVDFANANWHARYLAAKARAALHIAPVELGALSEGEDPYERVNNWMLEEASRDGADKVECIVLWNGEGGDGPGGTQHMMNAVREGGGHVHWLNTKQLWR